jgi:hypothetical protein
MVLRAHHVRLGRMTKSSLREIPWCMHDVLDIVRLPALTGAPVIRTALNSRLWLYHGPEKRNSVVISAHGGYEKSTLAFDLRQFATANPTRVYFWSRHGYATTMKLKGALGIDAVAFGRQSGLDKRDIKASSKPGRSSMVVNYELFPYGETRADIDALAGDAAAGGRDIIVVRNEGRLLRPNVYLRDVIQAAQQVHPYTHFYCTFCRVLMGEGIKVQTLTPNDEGDLMSDPKMAGGWKKAADITDHGWEEDYTFL